MNPNNQDFVILILSELSSSEGLLVFIPSLILSTLKIISSLESTLSPSW